MPPKEIKELEKKRKDRLSLLVCSEVLQQDSQWADHENEELLVGFGLADSIVELLVNEVVGISKVED